VGVGGETTLGGGEGHVSYDDRGGGHTKFRSMIGPQTQKQKRKRLGTPEKGRKRNT